MKGVRRILTLVLAGALLCASLLPGVVMAEEAGGSESETTSGNVEVNNATGSASVSGYAADSKLQFGTIVRLKDGETKRVEPATNKRMMHMLGVTVDPQLLSLTLSDSSLENEVYVATSGTFEVLVSTQNGTIAPGDFVTLSAIDGVGMKAGTYQEHETVFGRAVSGFDGQSVSMGSVTLTYDGNGETETVQLGLITLAINIQRNPNDISTKANLPPFLERLGQIIAERQVSPLRMYLALGITGLTVIVALVVLSTGVRNSIISIGRNPLSRGSILRGLLEIILTSLLILIVGLFAVYLLLKL